MYTNMIMIPAEGSYKIVVRASTVDCRFCDNTGIETYVLNKKQGYGPCPECMNRDKGIPIPYGDLGLPLPRLERL